MADCASLLDEELSSFVFNYLTENSGSQYGEEEVCSDRLDADFPDIDLSQLDASDFDSVNCLSELHWCNDHTDRSPASIHYSTGDPELFQIEEENAALLAALTDSLDGMVEDEVGGLSVFPSLGEGPEEEEDLPLDREPFPGSLSPETEDPSLLEKLLLSPPNVPVGLESHKEGSVHRHSSRIQHLKPARPLQKCDRPSTQERKTRAVRPAGRLCTELHRHLTTAQEAEDTPSADTEEEEEEEEEEEDDDEEDSDSDEEEEDEEDEESSSSEGESSASVTVEPAKPQFASEKELHSVVELIKYMHTYCLPTRKQASWDRKEREAPVRRARPELPPAPRLPPNCHKAAAPPTQASIVPRPRVAFARRREVKAHSLLKELLEAVNSFDVSKPYRLHSPPYAPRGRGGAAAKPAPAPRPAKAEPRDCESERALFSASASKRSESPEPEEASFSVRRSRRLASFPSRFAKKVRPGRVRVEASEEEGSINNLPIDTLAETTQRSSESNSTCCTNEKRACLCLPLTPKSTGDTQYANKPFEQTLCVELCGTAGLTPPTTPPHKPVEEELFKPEGKGEPAPTGTCVTRAHTRKQPEQTELYAQLRRMGQAGDASHRSYGDHDYCLLSLAQVESRKRPAAALTTALRRAEWKGEAVAVGDGGMSCGRGGSSRQDERLFSKVPEYLQRADGKGEGRRAASPHYALSPRNTEEGGERSPLSRSPSPNLHSSSSGCCPSRSPSSKLAFSCENAEMCHTDKQRTKTKSAQQNRVDNCQVFYIHNLPSSVTQTMLRKRFEAFGDPDDCTVVIKNEERCGVITFRPTPSGQSQRHKRESHFHNGGNGGRRFSRKRYIDLDEAGPGPVKSKYDALDFDTLLKEAQKSLHR